MKKFLFYAFISFSTIGYAQDQLLKKDNSKIEVKILEINQKEIKYKLFTYQDGPTIIIAKKEVALIIYQNGLHEIINATPEIAVAEQPVVVYNNSYSYRPTVRVNQDSIDKTIFKELVSTKNLISFNAIEPMNGSFGVNYIREFAHNYLHVYVPVSVGFTNPYFTQLTNGMFNTNNNNYNYYNYGNYTTVTNYKFTNKTYEAGLGIHFQTSGKHVVTHFVGPYFGIAEFKGSYDETTTTYDALNNFTSTTNLSQQFTMERVYVMLDNGILIRATKNFNIMMMAGLGYRTDTYKGNDPTKSYNFGKSQLPINAFKFGLSFGYRF